MDIVTLQAARAAAKRDGNATYAQVTRRGTLAVLADSISSYDQASIPGKITRNWLGALSINSGQRVRHGGIWGTGGYTLQQIRDVHLPQLLASPVLPEACCIAGGTNNATDQAAGIAALLDIINALRAKGIRPILWIVPPREDGALASVSAWNAKVRGLAARDGYQVVDAYSPLVLPSTAGFKSAALKQDAIHPTAAGHLGIATPLANDPSWLGRFGYAPPYLAAAISDSANLVGDPGLFTADANSDGVSDGWNGWGTANWTGSRSTDADGYVWQRLTKAAGGTGQGGLQFDFSSGFSVGDTLSIASRVRLSAADMGATISLSALNGTTQLSTICESFSFPNGGFIVDGVATTQGVVPANCNKVRVNVQVSTLAPAAQSYVEVARLTVINRNTLTPA